VEDARLVSRDLDVLDKSRVRPDAQRVVREAGAADKLLVRGAPLERSNLAASVDAVGASARGRVPEVDHTVVRTTTSSEKVGLPRAPGESLDGSLVVGLLELGCVERTSIPDADEVVIATSGQLSTIGAPLKTANLTSVRDKLGNLVLGNADIVVVDETGASTGGKEVLVPAHDANAGVVAEHAAELGALLDVPDLDFTRTKTGSNIGTILTPLNRRDVGVSRAFEERVDFARLSRPDVDGTLETNGDLVARRPVEEVEVVIINKTRCIKNTLRGGCDAATELGGSGSGLEGTVVLRAQVNGSGRLRSGRLEGQDSLSERNVAGLGDLVLVCGSLGRRLVGVFSSSSSSRFRPSRPRAASISSS